MHRRVLLLGEPVEATSRSRVWSGPDTGCGPTQRGGQARHLTQPGGDAVDAVIAVVCVVEAVIGWRQGVQTTQYAPMGEVPGFTATLYSGPW
uniref:hypothetical protein n=1 Tax=Nocardia cyriacigeorgica TaxID=135487 RepID=UPI0024540600